MTTDDANAFLMGAGGKSATFHDQGDEVWGSIVHYELRQQTDFDSKALKVWDDGNPMMQVVVTLQTNAQDDVDDDGLRKVYVRGQMTRALSIAVAKAEARGIAVGGQLFVRYVSDDEPRSKGMSGAKQYFVKYEPPTLAVVAEEQRSGATESAGADVPEIDDKDLPF